MSYVFVLGAGDPEMSAIERVCQESNYIVLYASVQGQRVHAGNAYQADSIDLQAYPGSTPSGLSADLKTIKIIILLLITITQVILAMAFYLMSTG